MLLKDAAMDLGVEIPEGMEKKANSPLLLSQDLLDKLQKRFDLFGVYFDAAKSALDEILENDAIRLWLTAAAAYYRECDHDNARDLPVPVTNGTAARDFLPLMVMLPTIEDAFDNYVKRGFSERKAKDFLGCVRLNLDLANTRNLGRPALTVPYFRWLAHYLKCTIFDHGGLNFEMKKAAATLVYLKNKVSGEIALCAVRESVHKSGIPLGSAGYEDDQEAFTANFEESEEAFFGHPVRAFRIRRQKEAFPKSLWERFLSPGEDIINVHIPRGADLTPQKIHTAYKEAIEIVAKCYPECKPNAFICSSWLMDPVLQEILGEESRISQFAAPYLRCPNKSNGKEVFSFVFRPFEANDLTKLPENTRLERALKEKYIQGEYVYAYTGMIPIEQI